MFKGFLRCSKRKNALQSRSVGVQTDNTEQEFDDQLTLTSEDDTLAVPLPLSYIRSPSNSPKGQETSAITVVSKTNQIQLQGLRWVDIIKLMDSLEDSLNIKIVVFKATRSLLLRTLKTKENSSHLQSTKLNKTVTSSSSFETIAQFFQSTNNLVVTFKRFASLVFAHFAKLGYKITINPENLDLRPRVINQCLKDQNCV